MYFHFHTLVILAKHITFFQKFVLFHDKILTTNVIIAHNGRFLETICVRVI